MACVLELPIFIFSQVILGFERDRLDSILRNYTYVFLRLKGEKKSVYKPLAFQFIHPFSATYAGSPPGWTLPNTPLRGAVQEASHEDARYWIRLSQIVNLWIGIESNWDICLNNQPYVL